MQPLARPTPNRCRHSRVTATRMSPHHRGLYLRRCLDCLQHQYFRGAPHPGWVAVPKPSDQEKVDEAPVPAAGSG